MNQTVMQAKRYDILACQPEQTLCQAASQMNKEHVSALVVTDLDGYMVGLISQADLLRARLEHQEWDRLPVSDYMTKEVISVSPQSTLLDVAKILLDNQIHRIVVAQEEHDQTGTKLRPLSVISAADLVYHMVRE
jgi:CBS domain-containing protein